MRKRRRRSRGREGGVKEQGGGGGKTKEISMRGGGKRGENKPTNQTGGSGDGPWPGWRRGRTPTDESGGGPSRAGRAGGGCQASELAGCNRRIGRAEPDGRVTKA